jgi:hypothetical protein
MIGGNLDRRIACVLSAHILRNPLDIPIRKETMQILRAAEIEKAMREKKPVVGTIVGVFDGTLNGIQARLITRTRLGYIVELLESKNALRKGDQVHLRTAEFYICKAERK